MSVLSVVLPAYNEEAMLLKTARRLSEILNAEKIQYQLVFVDDGSTDHTWECIRKAAENDPGVTGIHFPEISEKKQPFSQGSPMRTETARRLWTAICSIRRKSW